MTSEAGGRSANRLQQPLCMKDGGGLSGAGYRISPQTAWRSVGISSKVVKGLGNGEDDSSGMCQEGERM